jgi:hypothetical protein
MTSNFSTSKTNNVLNLVIFLFLTLVLLAGLEAQNQKLSDEDVLSRWPLLFH